MFLSTFRFVVLGCMVHIGLIYSVIVGYLSDFVVYECEFAWVVMLFVFEVSAGLVGIVVKFL